VKEVVVVLQKGWETSIRRVCEFDFDGVKVGGVPDYVHENQRVCEVEWMTEAEW
jgi:hypothetical protein